MTRETKGDEGDRGTHRETECIKDGACSLNLPKLGVLNRVFCGTEVYLSQPSIMWGVKVLFLDSLI